MAAPSRNPIVTGTSVLAIKFDGGVVIAADTLGSYGSLARFRDIRRLVSVGNQTVVGASGDVADFHSMKDTLDELEVENREYDDEHTIKPKAIFSFLTRVLYNRRSRMNPLWNSFVVAGVQDGEPFLGTTDKVGVAFTEDTIATGYGAYIALPLLRNALESNDGPLTRDQAVAEIEKCCKVLFYRDARSLNRYEVAVITAAGVEMFEPKAMETDWSIATMVRGYE
ncbi:uncharacterized protein MONBRDRAFT_11719 [Monosiga brevicollis MX1]|uniref:Proteasome subunit beta n=1 Tax=Monosiga brevicollis TaxID=81824 RepID=A9VA31_MONBE|nr:uncharacterized protein MONBRDRAFT_11719 [Monosiga brevicollis MX1]EDQ85595.1 predicted protein [Monosiga brevicollis MX1]|eukprot:XP_001749544.1 hypothetical protein [Monosiga brevicollis MX1]